MIEIAAYAKTDRMIIIVRSPTWVKHIADITISSGHDEDIKGLDTQETELFGAGN